MELVRGPSWVAVKLSLWFQVACILAAALALSFWCIVIGASYLVDPEVGATKIVAMSLVGLIIPFGLLAYWLAMPVIYWGRRVPVLPRLLLAALPWVAVSRSLMIRLPIVYHRGPADIIPGRFNWLWLSITFLAALIGPISAEQWFRSRILFKRQRNELQAKLAEANARIAQIEASRRQDIEKNVAKAAAQLVEWRGRAAKHAGSEQLVAVDEAQVTFWEVHYLLAKLDLGAESRSERERVTEIRRAFVDVLRSNPGGTIECCRNRSEAIRRFIRETDELNSAGDISNVSPDPVPGDVSRAAGH